MRAVLACEGLPAASANVNDMFISVAEDLDRQKARGRDGAYAIRRIINIVNNHALTPVIRKYHEEGQQASAEALAGRLLPEPQVIVTIDDNQSLSIEKSKVQEKLSEILNEKTDEATSLDPVTQLEWFTKSFVANTTINSADYAVFAINPILTLWPQPLAQEALSIATPLLASSKYKKADALRLKTGLAIAQAKVCRSSETALQSLLDEIATQERAAVRVNAVADYLIYLESHDDALPICTN